MAKIYIIVFVFVSTVLSCKARKYSGSDNSLKDFIEFDENGRSTTKIYLTSPQSDWNGAFGEEIIQADKSVSTAKVFGIPTKYFQSATADDVKNRLTYEIANDAESEDTIIVATGAHGGDDGYSYPESDKEKYNLKNVLDNLLDHRRQLGKGPFKRLILETVSCYAGSQRIDGSQYIGQIANEIVLFYPAGSDTVANSASYSITNLTTLLYRGKKSIGSLIDEYSRPIETNFDGNKIVVRPFVEIFPRSNENQIRGEAIFSEKNRVIKNILQVDQKLKKNGFVIGPDEKFSHGLGNSENPFGDIIIKDCVTINTSTVKISCDDGTIYSTNAVWDGQFRIFVKNKSLNLKLAFIANDIVAYKFGSALDSSQFERVSNEAIKNILSSSNSDSLKPLRSFQLYATDEVTRKAVFEKILSTFDSSEQTVLSYYLKKDLLKKATSIWVCVDACGQNIFFDAILNRIMLGVSKQDALEKVSDEIAKTKTINKLNWLSAELNLLNDPRVTDQVSQAKIIVMKYRSFFSPLLTFIPPSKINGFSQEFEIFTRSTAFKSALDCNSRLHKGTYFTGLSGYEDLFMHISLVRTGIPFSAIKAAASLHRIVDSICK